MVDLVRERYSCFESGVFVNRFRKLMLSTGTVIAIIVGTIMGTTQPAAAHAAGNSTWGVICAFDVCIPSGTMLHVVDGSGVALSYDRVQVTSASRLCNWWVDFDYYDNNNNRYRHVQGATHNGCTNNDHVRVDYYGPYLWKPGRACAVLYSSSIHVTTQCHYLS